MPGVYYLEGGIYHPRVFLGGNVLLKRCSECKEWKAKSEFYKNKSKKDGLHNWCKKCQAKFCRKYHQDNREHELKRMREYSKRHEKERKEYYLNHKEEKRKHSSKQRGLGYNTLNEWFKGAVMHHIDNENVVFIPDKIHRRFNGRGHTLEQHRAGILQYYGSIERMINDNPI